MQGNLCYKKLVAATALLAPPIHKAIRELECSILEGRGSPQPTLCQFILITGSSASFLWKSI